MKLDYLTKRQVKFINHYQLTGRGAESARVAGYGKHSAKWTAYKLLHSGKVKRSLDRLKLAGIQQDAKARQ